MYLPSMLFGVENTSLLVITIVLVALIGIVLPRKQGQKGILYSNRFNFPSNVLTGFSLFSSLFFIILAIILPAFRPYSWEIALSLILSIVLTFAIMLKVQRNNGISDFVSNASQFTKILISTTFVMFLGFVQVSVLMYLGILFSRYFFEGSIYSILVLIVISSGFTALLGDSSAINISDAFMGIVNFIILFSLLFIPNVLMMIGPKFPEVFIIESRLFNFEYSSDVVAYFLPVTIALMILWVWIFEKKHFNQTNSSIKNIFFSSPMIFLVLVISMILLITSEGEYRTNLDNQSSQTNNTNISLPIMIVISFFLMGSLTKVFNLIKKFSNGVSWLSNDARESSEREILVGRLSVTVFAIFAILFFPIIILLGERVILLNVLFSACFLVPITAMYLLFIFWKGLTSEGLSLGISAGIIAGIVLVIISKPLSLSEEVMIINPFLMPLISSGVTLVSGVVVSMMSVLIKKKTTKISIPFVEQ